MPEKILWIIGVISILTGSYILIIKWTKLNIKQLTDFKIIIYIVCNALLIQGVLGPVLMWKTKKMYLIFIVVVAMLLLISALHYFNKMLLPVGWEKVICQQEIKRYICLTTLPVSIFVVQMCFCYIYKESDINLEWVILWFVLCDFITFLSMHFIICYFVQENEIQLYIRYQKESKEYMKMIRSQRHDFNFHLHAVSGLVENKEFDKCQEYIRSMVKEADEVNELMPIQDATVGSLLFNFKRKAHALGFEIAYDIRYDMANILCTGFECNKILGNLLQNSIDAVSKLKDKSYVINLSIFKRRGNTVIICENKFEGKAEDIAKCLEYGYTTKKHHEGIGLGMVALIVKKYGGRIYTEFDEDVVRFIVNIPNSVGTSDGR